MTSRNQNCDAPANALGERTVRGITGPQNVPAALIEEIEMNARAHSQGDESDPQCLTPMPNGNNRLGTSNLDLHTVETGATLVPRGDHRGIVIATFLLSVVCLGLPYICRRLLADSECKLRGHSLGECDCDIKFSDRWRRQSPRLLAFCYPVTMWGAMTMIAASIAYIQIDDIENNPWTGVIVSMSTICAFGSAVPSVAFYLGKGRLSGTTLAYRWFKASRETNGKSTVFWFLLTLPLVWLFWSVILFLTAMLFHVWMDYRRANILGPLAVTMLLMVVLIQVLWILKVFFDLEGETEEVDEISTVLSVLV